MICIHTSRTYFGTDTILGGPSSLHAWLSLELSASLSKCRSNNASPYLFSVYSPSLLKDDNPIGAPFADVPATNEDIVAWETRCVADHRKPVIPQSVGNQYVK